MTGGRVMSLAGLFIAAVLIYCLIRSPGTVLLLAAIVVAAIL
jgi:hypothetical protein